MLILDDPNTWPKHIMKKLNKRSVLRLLKQHKSFNPIQHEWYIQDISAYVKEHAESVGVAGYHCTKQVPERLFAETGLKVVDLKTHHAYVREIMRRYRPDLTKEQLTWVRKAQAKWCIQQEGRQGQLWFCLTRHLVLDGTEDFFRYFGGEVGSWPILAPPFSENEHPELEAVLEQIGEPVVVEVKLNPSRISRICWPDLGGTLVCYFASSVNPDFSVEDCEGYVTEDIPPQNVVRVHPYRDFIAPLE